MPLEEVELNGDEGLKTANRAFKLISSQGGKIDLTNCYVEEMDVSNCEFVAKKCTVIGITLATEVKLTDCEHYEPVIVSGGAFNIVMNCDFRFQGANESNAVHLPQDTRKTVQGCNYFDS